MPYSLRFLRDSKNRKVFDRWSNTFVVYLIVNLVNKKKYVGVTKHIKTRVHEHIRYSVNEYKVSMYLHKAIRKYGLQNFTIKILRECENYNTLNDLECEFIKKHKSNNPKFGYNLTSGGKAGVPNDITIIKKRESSKKINVGQYDLNGNLIEKYESIMEASRQLNIKNSDIHRCCKKGWSRNGFLFYKSNMEIPEIIDPFVSKRGLNFKGKSLLPHNRISGVLLNKLTGQKFSGSSIIELSKIVGISKDTIFRIRKKGHKIYKFMML